MCGIVGYTGEARALPILLEALHRLEYRGYDSAGVAVEENGGFFLEKVKGKIAVLEEELLDVGLKGTTGIGHTRWATHGPPSVENAHPHFSKDKKIMLVHNGIIENHVELRSRLEEDTEFVSATDTEVLVHMLSERYNGNLTETLRSCLNEVEGSYAVVAMHRDEPGVIVAARSGSPLIIGCGSDGMYAASDLPALLDFTRDVIFLDEDELATLRPDGVEVQTLEGEERKKAINTISWGAVEAQKSGYKHFMFKEIAEQPQVLRQSMRGRISEEGEVVFSDLDIPDEKLRNLKKITLIACGTSYHACMVARYWLEEFSDLQIDIDIGSEYRYRTTRKFSDDELMIAVSQSGETADTLAAMRKVKEGGMTTLAICNVLGSTMTREADGVIYTHAGPEIGVASTKSFTTQLVVLLLFTLYLNQVRGSKKKFSRILAALKEIPEQVERLVSHRDIYEKIANEQFKKEDFLFLGRHLNYPVAMEGALKLKEISYIHAEGYPAGEMKHGPIALIDEEIPVVVLGPRSRVYDKMVSNIEEAKARGGLVIGVGMEDNDELAAMCDYYIGIPDTRELLTPLLTAIPMQILSYDLAVRRGCDVDQPRNLAKSVTVE
ncbi:MAG: glutamine--fructose-6-phosphate transaminase (isomerizing) [bacterium]